MGEALAYLLTWTTYGTWLPGDQRGWHDRRKPSLDPRVGDFTREAFAVGKLAEIPFLMEPDARPVVEAAIQEACQFKGWLLYVASVGRNHVHVVVTARGVSSATVENTLKGRSTFRLKQLYPSATRRRWWTEKGSRRSLHDEASLSAAINYVRDQDISWMKHPRQGASQRGWPNTEQIH